MNELVWNDVSFTVSLKSGEEKTILDRVSGSVKENQLVAILGPTASGKTCLLNVLSGRVQYSNKIRLFGHINFNGKSISSESFHSKVGYILQEDSLFSYLTVRETLTLAAYFHSSITATPDDIRATVDGVLRQLSLNYAQNTIIGSATRRGVSGGERKRTAIGNT